MKKLVTLLAALVVAQAHAADQTWTGGGTGNGTAWFTTTNWAGGAFPGATPAPANTTNTDTATIPATGTNPDIGINLNFTGNTLGLGAINFTSTASRGIGDSSATPSSATLRLNGATVNAVANTVLRNTSTGTLSLQGAAVGSVITGVMSVGLGNATDNVVSIENTGGISINAVLKDSVAGAHLTVNSSGSGALTLTGSSPNTYTGGTTVTAGALIVNKDGGLGTGNITLNGGTVVLTLQGGTTKNYINDSATISISNGAVANLNFTGNSDTVSAILLNGVAQTAPGTYGGTGSGADFQSSFFTGSGTLTLIPEPSTYMLLGAGLLVCALRFRRRATR